MKKIVFALVGCGLALSHVSAENKTEGKGKAPGKRPDGSFFRKLDKDDDKAISKEEAGEYWGKMSQRDTNKDGKVTVQELMAGRSGAPGGPGGDGKGKRKGKPGEMFKRADKNEDGKLSKDEVPAEAWERLGKLDRNKDGAVSKEEMAAGMAMMRGAGKGKGGPGAGGPEAIFGRMDTDKDGKLSSEEVPAEMWAKLSKADENADGLVSKEELGKVYKARAEAGKTSDTPKKKRPELEKESA